MATLLRRAARQLDCDVVRRHHYDLVRRTPYSPIPDLPPASAPVWNRKSDMPGIELDLDAQLDWLRRCLAPSLAEFMARFVHCSGNAPIDLRNGYYQLVDAALLFAMVRHFRPRRLLELGSGFSTLISAEACLANAREGQAVDFVSVDPEPRTTSAARALGVTRLERQSAADIPLDTFLDLDANDILFVDTTHTVKLGSEVNYLILEALPRLKPGVIVHFHDIFLPFEYPRHWFERGTYLSEQYLLQAFLIDNDTYQVLFATHAVSRAYPDQLAELIPIFDATTVGQESFWIQSRPR